MGEIFRRLWLNLRYQREKGNQDGFKFQAGRSPRERASRWRIFRISSAMESSGLCYQMCCGVYKIKRNLWGEWGKRQAQEKETGEGVVSQRPWEERVLRISGHESNAFRSSHDIRTQGFCEWARQKPRWYPGGGEQTAAGWSKGQEEEVQGVSAFLFPKGEAWNCASHVHSSVTSTQNSPWYSVDTFKLCNDFVKGVRDSGNSSIGSQDPDGFCS